MNIYLVERTEERSYDTHNSCVVLAESKETALLIHPNHPKIQFDGEYWDWVKNPRNQNDYTWASSPEKLKVTLLGTAASSFKKEKVITSSFTSA